jgi:hypothetical protein
LRLKIELGVPNTGASAHHLNVASGDASGTPQAVAMGHRAVADISDDFHLRVGMRGETAVRRDFVIVPEAQCGPAGICIRWGEMMLGVEPIAPITRKRVKEPAFDHDFLREFCRVSWLQRFSLKIEFFETFGF